MSEAAAAALTTGALHLYGQFSDSTQILSAQIYGISSVRRASKMFQLAGFVMLNYDHCAHAFFLPFFLHEKLMRPITHMQYSIILS